MLRKLLKYHICRHKITVTHMTLQVLFLHTLEEIGNVIF